MPFRTGLALAILVSLPSFADRAPGQLLAARENPFAAGHHHLNVSDLEAHKRFWGELLGGELVKFGQTDVVKLPNALLFLRVQPPVGGSAGSSVNHLGFRVPDLRGLVASLQAAGVQLITPEVVAGATGAIHHNASQDVYLAFAQGPDGLRVELMEDRAVPSLVAHHIHIFTPDDAAAQAWYVRHFGGRPGTRGQFRKADVPGIELTFADAGGPVAPTQGRVLDHIGFEVDDLEALCAKLERAGLQFDVPFRRIEGLDLSVAFLTDPWGTYIELTEGLDRL